MENPAESESTEKSGKRKAPLLEVHVSTCTVNLEDDVFIQLLVTKGAHNPNLQVAITVCDMCMYTLCNQHSFELPLRMSGMYIM